MYKLKDAENSTTISPTQLCENIVILEADSDKFNWGNATPDQPAFLTYVGCDLESEAITLKNTLLQFYRVTKVVIRPAERLIEFNYELKAWGLQRQTDHYAFGLDYLVCSQQMTDWHHGEPEDIKHLAYSRW